MITLFSIYFLVFVDLFQLSFLFPLMPRICEKFGGGATQVGMMGSVAALGEGLAAPVLGSFADKYGRRIVFIVALVGSIVSSIVIGYANSYFFLLVARLINGCCGGTAGVAAAFVADITDDEERPFYMTYYQAAIFLGVSAGPAVGGFIDHAVGYQATCFAAAGVCALNLFFVYFFVPDSKEFPGTGAPVAEAPAAEAPAAEAPAAEAPAAEAALARANSQTQEPAAEPAPDSPPQKTPEAPPEPAAEPPPLPLAAWIISFACFLNSIGFMTFEALGVMYIQDEFYDGDPAKGTLFWSKTLSLVGIVGLVVNLFLYFPIVMAMGLKGSIAFGGFISAVCFYCIGIPLHRWWFAGWGLALVFFDNIVGTSTGTIITTVVDPSQFGYAIGIMTLAGNMARAFGPFFFGPVYEHVSKTLPWTANAAIKIVATGLVLSVKEKAQAPPAPDEGAKDDVSVAASDGFVQKERSTGGRLSLRALRRALSLSTTEGLLTPGATQEFAQASELLFGLVQRRRPASQKLAS